MKLKDTRLDDLDYMVATEPQYHRTDCISFDLVNAGRGLLGGAILNLYGSANGGKSTICHTIAKNLWVKYQKKTLYLASEISDSMSKAFGFFDENAEGVILRNPATYNDLEKAFWAFLSSDLTLMIIDSITAFSVSERFQGTLSYDEGRVAQDSAAQSSILKMMAGNLMKHPEKAIISILQTRANFNGGFGAEDEKASGGYASKFFCRQEFQIIGTKKVISSDLGKDSDNVIGIRGSIWAPSKNTVVSPMRKIPIMIRFGVGVSDLYVLLYYCQWKGIIDHSHGSSSYRVNFGGQELSLKGKTARLQWTQENSEILTRDLYENATSLFESFTSKTIDVDL